MSEHCLSGRIGNITITILHKVCSQMTMSPQCYIDIVSVHQEGLGITILYYIACWSSVKWSKMIGSREVQIFSSGPCMADLDLVWRTAAWQQIKKTVIKHDGHLRTRENFFKISQVFSNDWSVLWQYNAWLKVSVFAL